MSDWFEGYQDLKSNLSNSERDYEIGSANWKRGRTLLVSSDSIKEAIDYASARAGDHTDDSQRLQYLMTRSSVHHLEACFLLISNGLYNPTRSHIRYLYELYLLLKGLNQDPDKAVEVYEKTKSQLKSEINGELTGEKLATVDEFHSIIKNQRDDLRGSKLSELVWDHPSWSSVHPYSLESIDVDLDYDEDVEGSLLDISNTFAFGIGAQFLRIWEGTPFYRDLLEVMDEMFVRIQLATKAVPPPMFDSELKFWFGFSPW